MRGDVRAAVVGCGSLGGVIAGKLFKLLRSNLLVISRNSEINNSIHENGLVVDTGRTIIKTHPNILESVSEIDVPVDIAIVTTKVNTLEAAVADVIPHISRKGAVVLLQNGLEGIRLQERFGRGKIVLASVLWGSSMDRPGRYTVTAEGPFIVESGEHYPDKAALVETGLANTGLAAEVLNNVFPVVSSGNIKGVLWSKLAINASLTSLGAITGLSFGELVKNRAARILSLRIGSEIYKVSRSEGIKLAPLPGGIFGVNIPLLLSAKGMPQFLKHEIIKLIGKKHAKTQSSMLASIERGRKTEVDYLNGIIVELAKKHGIEAPFNGRVVEVVKMLEEKKLKPDPHNLSLFS